MKIVYPNDRQPGLADAMGNCFDCGRRVESTGGCSRCTASIVYMASVTYPTETRSIPCSTTRIPYLSGPQ